MDTEKCALICGKSASGKTTLAIKIYKNLIEKDKINTNEILVLIMNRHQGLTWKKELCLENSSETKVFTYQGFVRKELIKYWPLVEKNCLKIKKDKVRPEFVSADTANYMMEILVDFFRKKGYFLNITSTSNRIAANLVSNINKAALSLLDLKEIGSRIYNSLEVKEGIKKENYDQMDDVIDRYINRFLSQGVVDYGISVYLYNSFLLTDSLYLERLKKIKYIIVDDLDEASPAQLELINILAKNTEKAYLFTNPEGGFCNFYGADNIYLEENLPYNCTKIELKDYFSSNDQFINFADKINERTLNVISRWESKIPVYFDISSQLRSEMVEKIGDKIKELILKGNNPEDVVIISPFNDFILSSEIENRLKSEGINVFDTSKKKRLIDNPYVHCLIIVACLCSDAIKIKLTVDDYRNFFRTILEIDVIRASILSKNAIKDKSLLVLSNDIVDRIGFEKAERYKYLKNWVDKCRINTQMGRMPLDELFRRAFLELLITLPKARGNISICKNLSETAEKFIGILLQFNKMDNPEEKFIEFIKREASDFYSLRELEEIKLRENSVVITSPYSFLTSNINSKIQIWADINSNTWAPRNVKELTNAYVLRKTWYINDVYTDEIEVRNRQNNLISVIRCLMRKCSEKLYFYGSEYSVNGYEQQSSLSEIIMDIMSERGDIDGI